MPEPTADSSTLELVDASFPRGGYRAALFDFDGTLSYLRCRWPQVMIPMMADVLVEAGAPESRDELLGIVEEFVMRLNGKQTIYQMIQLAEEVTKRGGRAEEPLEYKRRYHDLLLADMGDRVQKLKRGETPPDDWTAPGGRALLSELRSRGMTLYLASGTDLQYVRDELAALQLNEFFEDRVYGALDDYEKFSKAMIVRQIVSDHGFAPGELLGFGDGYVEIEEVRRAGGTAIGVASDEEQRAGVNEWKRRRLILAGAHAIIPDYRDRDSLFHALGL